MNTYIFIWNPKTWDWDNLEDSIEQIEHSGKTVENWSCGNSKSIKPGDRIFLVKLRTQPKGIIASGYAVSEPYLTNHYSGADKLMNCISIEFEVLLNPDEDPILPIETLKTGKLTKNYSWTPQASGIKIGLDIAQEFEAIWFKFLTKQKMRYNPFTHDTTTETFSEGAAYQGMLNRYERNPFARKACLDHYGFSCFVCSFNFQDIYGEIGKEFIHVHHLTQIAKVGKKHQVDPIKDLRPICPNCHATVHSKKEAISIEKLQSLLSF